MLYNLFVVALGGAVGSMLRYAISLLPIKMVGNTGFPLATLITNIAGAFLIGFLVALAATRDIDPHLMLLLKVGLCGGFTTFSTFALETSTLQANGNQGAALLYVVLSIVLSLMAIQFATTLVNS